MPVGMAVVTSPLSLARLLWWYGEDGLWEQALALSPERVADIGERAGAFFADPAARQLWAEPPRDWPLLLAVIEALEGRARPSARRRRRPTKDMPIRINATEEERWMDPQLRAVGRVVDSRNRSRRANP